jgi:hypothetical protein
MLVLGLLVGFGGGFVVGQRLAVPLPRGAFEVPRAGSGGPGSRVDGSVAQPVVSTPAPLPPVEIAPPAPAPAAAVVDAAEPRATDPEPRTSTPEPRAADPEPRTANPERRIPDPGSRITRVSPRPATVRFDSRPPGATIYLDEVRVGVTPLTLDTVASGTHQVRMEMLGHDTWRSTVTVKEGEQHFVGASLE